MRGYGKAKLWEILIALVLIAGCGRSSPTDRKKATLEERLIGLWRQSWVYGGTKYVGLTRFEAQEQFSREIRTGDESGEVVFWMKGHYFVLGDVVYVLIEDSSEPSIVGAVYKYQVLWDEDDMYLLYAGDLPFVWEKVESS